MFSPFYFRARHRAGTTPYDHCALNVALYGPGHNRWAFTEYPRRSVHCKRESLVIGDNLLSWNRRCLTCHIAETAAPLPLPIRGTLRLYPQSMPGFALALDQTGRHWWRPLIPRGRIEVELDPPGLRWSGTGYLDCNDGSTPLDEAMQSWTWLRAHSSAGTKVIYDVRPNDGRRVVHALHFDPSGETRTLAVPPRIALPGTLWRMSRETHADAGTRPGIIKTLEDAPFYSRTLLQTTVGGEPLTAIHESLSLDRFRSPWVRALLPFRMRRSRR